MHFVVLEFFTYSKNYTINYNVYLYTIIRVMLKHSFENIQVS